MTIPVTSNAAAIRPAAVAVIGAGPAGSVAAIRLAQLGHRVTLYEKASFPRDKVCGECVSSTGLAVLDRLAVASSLRSDCGPAVLTRARAVARDGSMLELALPRPMWGVTRRAMDQALATYAAAAGVEVHLATAATLTPRDDDAASAASVDLAVTPRGVRATARRTFDYAVLADGQGRALGTPAATGDFGIKAHFRDVDADPTSIELVALRAGYAGLAPVSEGLWNAAWSVPAQTLHALGGDLDAWFQQALRDVPRLARQFRRAQRATAWLACPLPRYAVRRDWPERVVPVGNAAAALEPVGGEGMGLAMRSAELAAEAIDVAVRAEVQLDVARLRRRFDELWRRRRAACRGGALALSSATIGPLAVGIACRAPNVLRVGLALVGK